MAILDAILNISKRSMMPEWQIHQVQCLNNKNQQRKKTFKSSSRSFWFSTDYSVSQTQFLVTVFQY